MDTTSEVFTDVSNGVWRETSQISGKHTAGTPWYIKKHVLRGGVSDGIDVIEIDNGLLRMRLLPTRGMGIWDGQIQGERVGWNSPVETPVHPAWVNLHDRGGLGWLQGFNELLCRCGLASHGAPGVDEDGSSLTLHGRIANLAAHRVEAGSDDQRLWVTGIIDESSMFGPRLRLESTLETRPGTAAVRIVDRVTNIGGQPAESELLYHTNVGEPFLGPGSRIVAPAQRVIARDQRALEGIAAWNAYEGPTAGFQEQAYFLELYGDEQANTSVMLQNSSGDRGFSVSYCNSELPCFTLWKNTQATSEGYVTGLEPGTSLPNLRSFERQHGRLRTLQPGESYQCSLELEILFGSGAVTDFAATIGRLASGPREICESLQGNYAPN